MTKCPGSGQLPVWKARPWTDLQPYCSVCGFGPVILASGTVRSHRDRRDAT